MLNFFIKEKNQGLLRVWSTYDSDVVAQNSRNLIQDLRCIKWIKRPVLESSSKRNKGSFVTVTGLWCLQKPQRILCDWKSYKWWSLYVFCWVYRLEVVPNLWYGVFWAVISGSQMLNVSGGDQGRVELNTSVYYSWFSQLKRHEDVLMA